ncbi:hypothetical protein [Rhodococcus koreensis]
MIDTLALDSATNGYIQSTRNHLSAVSNRSDAVANRLERDKAKLEEATAEPELVSTCLVGSAACSVSRRTVTFAHEDEIEQANLEADEPRLEVNSRENSPEALIKERLDTKRRRAEGQYRGWSLDLNTTERWAA